MRLPIVQSLAAGWSQITRRSTLVEVARKKVYLLLFVQKSHTHTHTHKNALTHYSRVSSIYMNPETQYSETSRNRYYRSSLHVSRSLRWLRLAEIEYCRVAKGGCVGDGATLPSASDPQHILPKRSFLPWEVVQRTTPTVGAETPSTIRSASGIPLPQHAASAVEVLCLLKDYRHGADLPSSDATKEASTPQPPELYLVLVSQYRPPLNAISLELPAGLVDEEDLSPAEAAIRELREETGYNVTVGAGGSELRAAQGGMCAEVDPDACVAGTTKVPLSYDPGLTDSLFHLVEVCVTLRPTPTPQRPKDTIAPDDGSSETPPTLPFPPLLAASRELRAQRNANPVPTLDAEEDIDVHLLRLDGAGVGSRLEALRQSIGPTTIVMGSVYTFVRGIEMAREI